MKYEVKRLDFHRAVEKLSTKEVVETKPGFITSIYGFEFIPDAEMHQEKLIEGEKLILTTDSEFLGDAFGITVNKKLASGTLVKLGFLEPELAGLIYNLSDFECMVYKPYDRFSKSVINGFGAEIIMKNLKVCRSK